ncbi:MAG: hypothetical protein ACKVQR_11870 [Aquabacterium sp.]
MRASSLLPWAMAGLSLLADPCAAQSTSSREQEQIRRLREELQATRQELATVRERAASAATDGGRQEARVRADRDAAARWQREALALREQMKDRDEQLSSARKEQADLAEQAQAARSARRQAAQRAAGAEAGREHAQAEAARLRTVAERALADSTAAAASLARARSQNEAMAGIARELIERLTQPRWADLVTALEPFVQRKRVELENLAQDLNTRVDAARLPAAPASAGATR